MEIDEKEIVELHAKIASLRSSLIELRDENTELADIVYILIKQLGNSNQLADRISGLEAANKKKKRKMIKRITLSFFGKRK